MYRSPGTCSQDQPIAGLIYQQHACLVIEQYPLTVRPKLRLDIKTFLVIVVQKDHQIDGRFLAKRLRLRHHARDHISIFPKGEYRPVNQPGTETAMVE